MATYAIGDIQGCFDDLTALLDRLNFDPAADRLWFTGDLVNRGPKSLETLRFVKALGDRAVTVLGNHDLHLLAVAHGKAKFNSSDNFDDVLQADDAAGLVQWLLSCPVLHHDEALGYTMIHAGLPPQWDLATARACALELESVLRGAQCDAFFDVMYGNKPKHWDEALEGWDRLRFITNCFTRLRYCDADGRLHMNPKGAPGTQPEGLLPWFQVPGRRSRGLNLIFGHWSTLGLIAGNGIYALDTGCLWGGTLTALCLESGEITSLDCPGARTPGK